MNVDAADMNVHATVGGRGLIELGGPEGHGYSLTVAAQPLHIRSLWSRLSHNTPPPLWARSAPTTPPPSGPGRATTQPPPWGTARHNTTAPFGHGSATT